MGFSSKLACGKILPESIPHNKRKQFAPVGAGRGKPRRCCGRYVFRSSGF
jgi:hypothetical protein